MEGVFEVGIPEPAPSVILIAAITSNGEVPDEDIHAGIEELWGPVIGWLEPYRFDEFTNYYSGEMGPRLEQDDLCVLATAPA